MTHFTRLSQNSVFLINNSDFFHSDFFMLKRYHIFDRFNEVVSFLVFLSGGALLFFSGGSLMCKNVSYFTRTNDQASYRHGLELHLAMIQLGIHTKLFLCFPLAVCPGEFGGGLWVLGPCLLITVDGRAGAGSRGLFPGVPSVLRWRKISKPVKA